MEIEKLIATLSLIGVIGLKYPGYDMPSTDLGVVAREVEEFEGNGLNITWYQVYNAPGTKKELFAICFKHYHEVPSDYTRTDPITIPSNQPFIYIQLFSYPCIGRVNITFFVAKGKWIRMKQTISHVVSRRMNLRMEGVEVHHAVLINITLENPRYMPFPILFEITPTLIADGTKKVEGTLRGYWLLKEYMSYITRELDKPIVYEDQLFMPSRRPAKCYVEIKVITQGCEDCIAPRIFNFTFDIGPIDLGLKAVFDDPTLKLHWKSDAFCSEHSYHCQNNTKIDWNCRKANGIEEGSEEAKGNTLMLQLPARCYEASVILNVRFTYSTEYAYKIPKFSKHQDLKASATLKVLPRKFKIHNLSAEIVDISVVLNWQADGEQHFPGHGFLVRRTRVVGSKKEVMKALDVTEKSVKWRVEKPPEKFEVEVIPTVAPSDVERLIATTGSITVDVPELVPIHAPTDVEAFRGRTPTEFYIDFEPLRERQIPGEDTGCTVQVCEKPDLSSICDSKTVPPRGATATYSFLQRGRVYYAAVACGTRAGLGPYSSWIEFEAKADAATRGAPRTIAPDGGVTHAALSPLGKHSVTAAIEVSHGLNTVLHWSLVMKDGSEFLDHYIKKLKVILHRRASGGTSKESLLITEDASLREIDIGLSPGYKFDLKCYSYELLVTLEGDEQISARTEETCHSFTSPGFLILFVLLLVIVASVGGFLAHNRFKEQMKRQAADEDGATKTGDSTSTSTGTTTKKRSKHRRTGHQKTRNR